MVETFEINSIKNILTILKFSALKNKNYVFNTFYKKQCI